MQNGRGKKCSKCITPRPKDIYGAYTLLHNSSSLRFFVWILNFSVVFVNCSPFFLRSFAGCYVFMGGFVVPI